MSAATLDASRYTLGSTQDRVSFARDLVAEFEKNGFVILQNHGISDETIQEMFYWNKQFFDLPLETKRSCRHPGGLRPVRGFNDGAYERSSKLHPGNEHLEDARDALESYNVGPIDAKEYPNQWVVEEELPTFRQHAEDFYKIFQRSANMILEAIELGLNLPAGSFLSRVAPDPSEMRMNHYPGISVNDLIHKNIRRIWPHTDFGIITLLFQDSEGGLEFEDRRNPGSFLPVISTKQSDLIVNISDIMQRWTNGVLRAGLHRVSVPRQFQLDDSEQDVVLPPRYSIAYFQRPGENKSAGPLENFVTEKRQAAYDEITAREHLERRNQLVY